MRSHGPGVAQPIGRDTEVAAAGDAASLPSIPLPLAALSPRLAGRWSPWPADRAGRRECLFQNGTRRSPSAIPQLSRRTRDGRRLSARPSSRHPQHPPRHRTTAPCQRQCAPIRSPLSNSSRRLVPCPRSDGGKPTSPSLARRITSSIIIGRPKRLLACCSGVLKLAYSSRQPRLPQRQSGPLRRGLRA